jgi:hypothetical protein
MLSDEQKRVALKKNMETMSKDAKKLRADGVEEVTLTYYTDEELNHPLIFSYFISIA